MIDGVDIEISRDMQISDVLLTGTGAGGECVQTRVRFKHCNTFIKKNK